MFLGCNSLRITSNTVVFLTDATCRVQKMYKYFFSITVFMRVDVYWRMRDDRRGFDQGKIHISAVAIGSKY